MLHLASKSSEGRCGRGGRAQDKGAWLRRAVGVARDTSRVLSSRLARLSRSLCCIWLYLIICEQPLEAMAREAALARPSSSHGAGGASQRLCTSQLCPATWPLYRGQMLWPMDESTPTGHTRLRRSNERRTVALWFFSRQRNGGGYRLEGKCMCRVIRASAC